MSSNLVQRSYDTEQGLMVAVADEDLVGESFDEGDVRIEVDEEFYGTEVAEEDEIRSELGRAAIANLVGENAVELGIETGVVDEENVLHVDGVPHAQMVRM